VTIGAAMYMKGRISFQYPRRSAYLVAGVLLAGFLTGCVTTNEPLTGQAIYYAKDYMTE
jgi:hypothetical protein